MGVRRSAKTHQPQLWMRSDDVLVGKELEKELDTCLLVNAETVGVEPKTVQKALQSSQANLWRKVMNVEYNSLIKNNVFTLVDLPEGCNVIDNKWVFKIKRNADGSLQQYKARLAAKGFHNRQVWILLINFLLWQDILQYVAFCYIKPNGFSYASDGCANCFN